MPDLTVYVRQALTGGAADALDGIDGASLLDNDMAIVTVSEISYIYRLDDNLGGGESSPRRILPDTNPGTKAWVLQKICVDGATIAGGTNTFSIVNGSASLTVSAGASITLAAQPPILGANTFTGVQTFGAGDQETKTAPAIAAGVLTINCALGNMFAVALNAAITSFTVSNIPAAGTFYAFALELTADGTPRAVTWTFQAVAVKWAGGNAPALTSTNAKKDTFVFYTWDAGTTWIGAIVGQNY